MNPAIESATKPSITQNVSSLMFGRVGPTRQKAIITLAKRRNITRDEARFHQAVRIAQSTSRKNG